MLAVAPDKIFKLINSKMISSEPQQPLKAINLNDRESRQIILQFQLKKVLLYGPSLGLYVLPSLDDPEVWNGIIFVRHGYYKEGKFKFDLSFQKFPQKAPTLHFLSKVFHPLVDEKTGELDILTLLQSNWRYGSDTMLYNILNNLQKMFVSNQFLSMKGSFNHKAGKLYEEDVSQFALEALKSVDESVEQFGMDSPGTIFSMQEIPQTENQKMRKELTSICNSNSTVEQKIDLFVSKLLS